MQPSQLLADEPTRSHSSRPGLVLVPPPPSCSSPVLPPFSKPNLCARGGGDGARGRLLTSALRREAGLWEPQCSAEGRGGAGPAARDLAAGGRSPAKGVGRPRPPTPESAGGAGSGRAQAAGAPRSVKEGHASCLPPRPFFSSHLGLCGETRTWQPAAALGRVPAFPAGSRRPEPPPGPGARPSPLRRRGAPRRLPRALVR